MTVLTIDRLREVLEYERSSGQFYWRIRTGRVVPGQIAGRLAFGYRSIKIDRQGHRAHRLAWFLIYGKWPHADLDHINGKRDDNRIENLRLATRAQNIANSRLSLRNSSGFKGVRPTKHGTWSARVIVSGKNRYCGSFKTAQEAQAAYFSAAQKAFGEFARKASASLAQGCGRACPQSLPK